MLVPVLFLYYLLIYKLYDRLEKLFISIIFGGLYFYGGIGASSYLAPPEYSIYFLIFLSVFVLFYRLKFPISHSLQNTFHYLKNNGVRLFAEEGTYTSLVIFSYLGICFVSLIYPEFKLKALISPPAPNGLEALLATIEVREPDVASKLIFYIKLLLLPFYYVSLSRFVKRPLILFLAIMLPLYLDYCSAGYIGRGMVLMNLGLWFVVVYWLNPRMRLIIGGLMLVGIPAILISFYAYSLARLGSSIDSVDNKSNIIEMLFYEEVNFPDTFKEVVRSGRHVDLRGFFVWLCTLPIPKFLLGGVKVPVLNYEISEIVLGLSRFDDGFWVKLTGYISESYYIFGKWFFWLTAVLVSRLCKTLFFFLRDFPGGKVLVIYVAIYIGFMYSRAGLGAIMPTFSNGFLLLYVYFLFKVYLTKKMLVAAT